MFLSKGYRPIIKGIIAPKRSIVFSKSTSFDFGHWEDVFKATKEFSPPQVEDVQDMSIHGLSPKTIRSAFVNLTTNTSTASSSQTLGRWKLSIDNFEKSYAYDHSA